MNDKNITEKIVVVFAVYERRFFFNTTKKEGKI
jgi:hypothetical protein